MKLGDIKDTKDYIVEASAAGSDSYTKFKELSKLNTGYQQLSRLSHVFQSGDWGALIDISGARLNIRDIERIKVQLHDILFNNPILVGYTLGSTADGKERLRLLGHAAGHGLELALSAALTVVFGAATFSAIASGAFSWTAGFTAAGTIGGAALTDQQMGYLTDIKAADDLYNIINAYDNIGSYKSIKRGLVRRFLDWVEHKSPDDIRREMQVQARIAIATTQHHFDKLVAKLPPTITYWDGNVPHEYPVAKLFELP